VEDNHQVIDQGEGVEPIMLRSRQWTAWIPDPDGTTIAIISVTSPSVPDWPHVADLAADVFDSFAWQERPVGRI
jgi:hypothetical protein